jgi:hypothetical protein
MIISAPISYYGMHESRKRLEKAGFHPSVTPMAPKEIEKAVIAYLNRQVKREPRKDFYESQRLRLGARKPRKKFIKTRGKGGNKGRGKGRDKGQIVLTQVNY